MKSSSLRKWTLKVILSLTSFFVIVSCSQDDELFQSPVNSITIQSSDDNNSQGLVSLFEFDPSTYKNILADQPGLRNGDSHYYPSSDLIQRVYDRIIEQNDEHDFLDGLIYHYGYPEWNVSVRATTPMFFRT